MPPKVLSSLLSTECEVTHLHGPFFIQSNIYPSAKGSGNPSHKSQHVQQHRGKPRWCIYLYRYLIFVLLAAPPHSRLVHEMSNKGKSFNVVIAMFKSVDVNVRPQEYPSEVPNECPAPGTAAYRERTADTESIAINLFYWMYGCPSLWSVTYLIECVSPSEQ